MEGDECTAFQQRPVQRRKIGAAPCGPLEKHTFNFGTSANNKPFFLLTGVLQVPLLLCEHGIEFLDGGLESLLLQNGHEVDLLFLLLSVATQLLETLRVTFCAKVGRKLSRGVALCTVV